MSGRHGQRPRLGQVLFVELARQQFLLESIAFQRVQPERFALIEFRHFVRQEDLETAIEEKFRWIAKESGQIVEPDLAEFRFGFDQRLSDELRGLRARPTSGVARPTILLRIAEQTAAWFEILFAERLESVASQNRRL